MKTPPKNKPELFNKEFQKQWSNTHKYKHIHTGEYCTFAAYLAEYLILRRSEKLNLGRPSYKFWTKGDPLHWIWKKQHGAAVQLSKKYSEEAILSAIKSEDFNKLLVIGIQNGRGYKINPPAELIIIKHQKQIDDNKNKIVVNLNAECEIKKLDTRPSQSYNTPKYRTMNNLRNHE